MQSDIAEKTLAIIKNVHFGYGQRGRVALWFDVYVTEHGAALQVFERPEEFIKIISDYAVDDVYKLAGKPCWVDTSKGGIIRWAGAWEGQRPVGRPCTVESTRLKRALMIVGGERKRQLLLKEQGRFKYTLSDDGLTDSQRLACIIEEVGEVSRNVLCRDGLVTDGDSGDVGLREELSQVAALAVAWMERLQ